MKFFTHSMPLVRQWTLGTIISSLPLLAAVGYAVWSLEQHYQRQQSLVDTAIVVNRHLVELQDEIKELERSARQYAILQDERVISIYQEKLKNFHLLTNTFLAAVESAGLQQQIRRLQELLKEDLLISAEPYNQDESLVRLTQIFGEAIAVQTRISDISQQVVNDKLQKQKESFSNSQFLLVLLGLLALPSSLVFQVVWAYVITKPMNKLSQTIDTIGRGNLDKPIDIEGPHELKVLAERLEWLRTSLKSIEDQKNKLLRHVTHELKTPLAAIFEASSLLQEQVPGPLNDDQLAVVKILADNANRLQDMITQLLNFNSCRLALENQVQQVDLGKLTKNLKHQYDSLINTRQLHLHLPSVNVSVISDPVLLEMIVSNLLSNALHFSPSDAEIRIHWAAETDHWWLEVTDLGPGIPESEKEKVFSPFFQGSNERLGSTKGTGLGLAIVNECVSQLQGAVYITDHQPCGTCIRVVFPSKEGGDRKSGGECHE